MRAVRRPVLLLALLVGVVVWWAFETGNAPEQFLPPGIYPVGSTIPDKHASGFGPCGNNPKPLGGRDWGAAGAVSLVAFPDEPAGGEGGRFVVRLVNRTDAVVGFTACDSRLFLTQEACGPTGHWRAVESHPEAICGNSFHRVSLDKNQYWELSAQRRSSPLKTRFRFRLDQGRMRQEEFTTGKDGERLTFLRAAPGGDVIYSNEFER